ncbi:MAG TPA: GAF domain-containing protein, partial [Anaerolineales bacterium]|nr:GAF domain-containing protein [Anaerolineales bacterium]
MNRQIKIQRALYKIADAASAVTDMQEFYGKLHEIVGKLMYARNFYVTLYDPTTQMISAPYFADEAGDVLPPPAILDKSNKSLRAYVLHTGKTLHISREQIEDVRRRGIFTPMGTPAEDWIGVPLKVDGQVMGSLTVQSYRKGTNYEEQDVRLLEFVAQHIAVALTRARAIEETRQRNAELAIINGVQAGLAGNLDLQAIYELVGEKIRETFNAQVVSIVTYDRAAQLMHGRYYFEDGKVLPGVTLPSFGFRKQVVEDRQPLIINKDMPHWVEKYGNPVLQGLQPKSAVFIPMLVGEETIGVISLQNNEQENAFTEADVRLLTTLANSMSVALENARLFDETQRLLKETQQRNAELAIINSVQEGLASQLEMQAIYELVGDKIQEIFDANTVVLATFDLSKGLMHRHHIIERGVKYALDPTPIPPIWAQFIQRGQSTLINENLRDFMRQIDPAFEVPVGEIPKSALSVPLRIQSEIRGVISLQNVDRENAFRQSDLRLLETLANSMSVALENARLFEETQQRNQELAIINSVQEGLASKLDMQAIYELIGKKVREVFHVEVID